MRISLWLCSLALLPQLAHAGAGLRSAKRAAQQYLEQTGGNVGPERQRVGAHIVSGLVYKGTTTLYVQSPGRNAKGALAIDVDRKNGGVPTRGTNYVTRLFDVEGGEPVHDMTTLRSGLNEARFDRASRSVVVREDWRHTANRDAAGNRIYGTFNSYSKSGRDAKGRFTPGTPKAAAVAKSAVALPVNDLRPELDELAKYHGIASGGPLPAWAAAAISHLTDPVKIQSAARLMMKEVPQQAAMILPFAVHAVGKPMGVQAGTEAAWRAALVEHDLK